MSNVNRMATYSCYCGQKGDINLNMLECSRCRRWCHERCVKCLRIPMLIGDQFYIFICSICNAGKEFIGRLEMKWNEVVHLLLYHLTISEKRKYFHIDTCIVPYLEKNWDRFHLFGAFETAKKNLRARVLDTLSLRSRFKCGKEIKKCKDLWALRIRVPPEAPDVVPTPAQLKKDMVVWEFQVQGRAYHILSFKKPKKHKENGKSGKSKLYASSTDCDKNVQVTNGHRSTPHENGINKGKHKTKPITISFNEESACYGLLDSIIPIPLDFKGSNNPFLTSDEKSSSRHSIIDNSKSFSVSGLKGRRVKSTSFIDLTVLSNSDKQLNFDDSSAESVSFLNTKEDILQKNKDEDLCVLGKRTTSKGKVQYLICRNREQSKDEIAEKEPQFQTVIFCKCSCCLRLDESEQ